MEKCDECQPEIKHCKCCLKGKKIEVKDNEIVCPWCKAELMWQGDSWQLCPTCDRVLDIEVEED